MLATLLIQNRKINVLFIIQATKRGLFMSCTCGRSPTGKCVGWHKLSEDDYLSKKADWEKKQDSKSDVA